MGFRLQIGNRVFAPSFWLTMVTAALLALFVSLGQWQWQRGANKQVLWDSFSRGTDRIVALDTRRTTDLERYAHVSVVGRYEPQRQFLLDNRTLDGRAGYEVLTPLRLTDGRVILVNRGWVPFTGFRDQLPDIAMSQSDERVVKGRIDELPRAGLAVGRQAPATSGDWPRVTNYPTSGELGVALGENLEERMLLLDGDEPHGYVRRWRPPGMEPMKHTSYAIQWWSFAVLLLVLFVGLNFRKVK